MLNISEIIFTLFNTTMLILFAVLIYRFFRNSKRSQKDITEKLNSISEEIKKLKSK